MFHLIVFVALWAAVGVMGWRMVTRVPNHLHSEYDFVMFFLCAIMGPIALITVVHSLRKK
jgi:hypothetical protein